MIVSISHSTRSEASLHGKCTHSLNNFLKIHVWYNKDLRDFEIEESRTIFPGGIYVRCREKSSRSIVMNIVWLWVPVEAWDCCYSHNWNVSNPWEMKTGPRMPVHRTAGPTGSPLPLLQFPNTTNHHIVHAFGSLKWNVLLKWEGIWNPRYPRMGM